MATPCCAERLKVRTTVQNTRETFFNIIAFNLSNNICFQLKFVYFLTVQQLLQAASASSATAELLRLLAPSDVPAMPSY